MSVVVTIAAGVVVVWAGVAIAVGIAIGRACRIADAATSAVINAAQDPDKAPLHISQALYVQDILDAAEL